jgi:hypothetical protein
VTSKDYELIVRSIRSTYIDAMDAQKYGDAYSKPTALEAVEQIAYDLAVKLGKENDRFDQKKFLTACGMGIM